VFTKIGEVVMVLAVVPTIHCSPYSSSYGSKITYVKWQKLTKHK
jgi:hypothetical protein